MPPIRVLDPTLIDQIAAGEVVVRPASAVKELVENSLDAGATRVTIEMDRECRCLRIADDGAGMAPDELELAILRHATSKISSFDDLRRVRTRGFRGEALASIVAVARVEILSRPHGALAGTRLVAEGGRLIKIEPAGLPPGTSVEVRDLFFNIPARLKFMKTPAAEWGQAQTSLTRQALAAPLVGFAVHYAERKAWEAPTGQSAAERAALLLGPQFADSMLEVEQNDAGIRFHGFIARPGVDRADRRQQYFLVNGRPIVSTRLSAVLQEAYKGLIMTRRHPMAALAIELDPEEVDVNVHPTKEEVRFREEGKVAGLLHRALTHTLRSHNFVPYFAVEGFGAGGGNKNEPRPPEGGNPNDILASRGFSGAPNGFQAGGGPAETGTTKWSYTPAGNGNGGVTGANVPQPPAAPRVALEWTPPAYANGPATLPDDIRPRPVGQVGDSFILAEAGDDLLIIDQHAAHERLNYARLRAGLDRGDIGVQPLFAPIPFEAAPADCETLERLIPHFAALGIEVEPFGGRDYLISAVPADLSEADIPGVVQDLLDAYHTGGVLDADETVRDRIVTRMACRASVKAGQRMSVEEMQRLIDDIRAARLPFTCPHGRPTMILLTKDQLERQFKRK